MATAGSLHLWAGGPRVVKICHYFKKSQTSRFYVTVPLSTKCLFNLENTERFFLSFMPDSWKRFKRPSGLPLWCGETGSPATHAGVLVACGWLRRLGCMKGGLCRGHQAGSEAGVGLLSWVEADPLHLWEEAAVKVWEGMGYTGQRSYCTAGLWDHAWRCCQGGFQGLVETKSG